jgi:hypothetical protein
VKKRDVKHTVEIKAQTSLLDAKIAMSVNIFIKKQKRLASSDNGIVQAILDAFDAYIDPHGKGFGKLEAAGAVFAPELMSGITKLLPGEDQRGQEEEKQMRKEFERYEGDVTALPAADQLVMGLLDREPETKVLLRAFTLKEEFAETVENLEDSVRMLKRACKNLVTNTAMPLLLQFILSVGNKLNASNSRLSSAEGITLESLAALEGVETNVKGKKFLHWVAEHIKDENVDKQLEELRADIDTVVSVVDLQQLVKEEHQLSTLLTMTKSATETTHFSEVFKDFFDTVSG